MIHFLPRQIHPLWRCFSVKSLLSLSGHFLLQPGVVTIRSARRVGSSEESTQ